MSITKHRLFALIRSRCDHEELLWLTSVLLFHDPTQDYHLRSPHWLVRQIPAQKSLFGAEADIGLPIGNLTSQFFANVYLNGLDQFVKHTLKCRHYVRYVDDFVLLHPNRAQLLEWQRRIEEYLISELDLTLHPTRRKLKPVSNGIDMLGYIVRPHYILCRRRVVNNLKARLRQFRQEFIEEQPQVTIVRYPQERLEEVFVCLNSYLGHFKHANSFRLRQRLFDSQAWLKHFFRYKNGRLSRLYTAPTWFWNLRAQYEYWCSRFHRYLLFFQVGCFYEFYQSQARKAIETLGLKAIPGKHGFRLRCGIGVKGLDRYVRQAMKAGLPVVVVNQTGFMLQHVAERRVAVKYVLKDNLINETEET